MSILEWVLLLGAGIVAGLINAVASGGSFFTYPAMLLVGLTPIEAATSTLAALTPGNLAAVPEYWPEVRENSHRYPGLIGAVVVGGLGGIALLLITGADGFEALVPWLILIATISFWFSPQLRELAVRRAPSLTHGRAGLALLLGLSVYLTYFGSGVGNLMFATLTIRGFGDFHRANAAKNIVMTVGTLMATVAYTIVGWISWLPVLPVLVGSAIGARVSSKVARHIPERELRIFVVLFGLFVAGWMFAR